ncbi:MAG TPA: carboxypeptidase-like regulatory domain-containing protein, partial [Bryobacteraceae bacterium]|nr:carboxypeptidase-like regulatory domain-containing protein [Bryobacteraceae bacterium]
LALGLIAWAGLSFGQFESGTVLGSVHDPSGGSVGGAQVTLENTKTGVISLERPAAVRPYNDKLSRQSGPDRSMATPFPSSASCSDQSACQPSTRY